MGMVEKRSTEERNRGSDYCSARPVSADECDEGKDWEIKCLSYVQNVQCGGVDCISHCQRMQTEYKGRHDTLAKVIHWDLCKKYGVKVQSKWYDHVPEKVEETDHIKILWDLKILWMLLSWISMRRCVILSI